jgi:hypothetical protein
MVWIYHKAFEKETAIARQNFLFCLIPITQNTRKNTANKTRSDLVLHSLTRLGKAVDGVIG